MAQSLAQRLRIKSGHRVLALNAPPDYVDMLGPLPDGVAVDTQRSPDVRYDVVHLFAKDKHEVDVSAPIAVESVDPEGLLWISYPKRSGLLRTDISRDTGWDSLFVNGWDAIAQVSVDDNWSALRFRPTGKITYTPGSRRQPGGRPA